MVKKFTKHVFFTIILLLIVVFITGLLSGRYIERAAESELSFFLKENELIIESYLLEQALIRDSGEDACRLGERRIEDLSSQLGEIGRRLSMPDAGEMLGEVNYGFLKRKYHLLQIRTYFMFEQLAERCDVRKDIVLYYYGPDAGLSTRQGQILDQLVAEKGIIVFAIEHDYSKELAFVEHFYGITGTPSMVTGFGQVHHGLVEYDDLVLFLAHSQ